MIEDALFLALGFCSAIVLAIALLPVLWARALRLTTQRLELLVPWSKSEIDAERDGIRAQAAVEYRRLEQEADKSRAALAERDATLGRRTVEIVELETVRDALMAERETLKAELARQARELADAEGQRFAAEKALHDADRRIETDAVAARLQGERLDEASRISEERRGSIAALEIRVAGLTARVEDREDALRRREAEASTHKTSLDELMAQHHKLGEAHKTLERSHKEAQQALAAEQLSATERDRRLQGRTQALESAQARIAEQEAAMKRKDEELAALRKSFDALMAELAARREDTDGDAVLRSAIVAAGDDTLHLLAERPESDADTAASPVPLVEGHS